MLSGMGLFAQTDEGDAFTNHLEQAQRYRNLQLYLECVQQAQMAVDLAQEKGWTERYMSASITLAEYLRASENYQKGIDVLYALKNTEAYPRLHVRKLGRLAALYHEATLPKEMNQLDSVRAYLDQAVVMAEENEFLEEEASLKNELGYFVSKNEDLRKGLTILMEAAAIYKQLDDTRGYVRSMTHVLDDYIELGNDAKANELGVELVELIEDKKWYTNELDLYNLLSKQCKYKGQRLCELEWKIKARKSNIRYIKAINTSQMADFRVIQETQKFKEDAEEAERLAQQKELALKEEESHTRELRLYLALILIVVLAVSAFWFRERKLKRVLNQTNEQLADANQKYQTLLVESNHRIKNNLQMVISMLKYASKDLNDKDSLAFKRMSGKIYTVSALHKHLYMNDHNERVSIKTYFEEIIDMYRNISTHTFQIDGSLAPAEIQSERMVYFGLIFNEVLTNTFEHNSEMHPTITIEVTPEDSENKKFKFSYSDGSNYGSDYQEGNGIGLIRKLIKRVGGNEFSLDPNTGTYQFEFYA
ncbi:sensor histidine kinase [bacterium SCSIO 12741]|nr:sensor histidine kinase [bacterium SCSIO 12741]